MKINLLKIKRSLRRLLLVMRLILILIMSTAPACSQEIGVLPEEGQQREWTWLVFMNGDNDLDPFVDEDFQEMMQIGSNEDLHIVTLTDREHGPASMHYVRKGKVVTIQPMGEIDMGDWRVLVDFVKTATTRFPGHRTVVSIWNHGNGWYRNRAPLPEAPSARAISFDDQSGNSISTPQLGQAMKAIRTHLGHEVEILSMDACLMQMIEVAWELRGTCRYIVASEEMEPGNGYPYHHLLAGLSKNVSTKSFLRHWVDVFADAYDDGYYGMEESTLSAIEVKNLPAVKKALDQLAELELAGSARSELQAALKNSQAYSEPAHIDIGDFALQLRKLAKEDSRLARIATSLFEAVQKAVVHHRYVDDSMSRSHGLAIYFPQDLELWYSSYLELQFSRDSSHDELIQDFLAHRQARLQRSINEEIPALVNTLGNFGQKRYQLYATFQGLCEEPHQ